MIENNNPPATDDEISLIDLLVILLKHRRLIIRSVLGSMILGLALVLLLPGYQFSKAVSGQVAEGKVNFMISSALNAILGEEDSTNFINQALQDPLIILQALRESGYERLDDNSRIDSGVAEEEAVSSVRSRFIQSKDQSVYKATYDDGTGSIIFKGKDDEKISSFLVALVRTLNKELAEYSLPYARSKVEAFEALLRTDKANEATGLTVVQNHENYTLIKNYLSEGISPIPVIRGPHVFKTRLSINTFRKDAITKAIILVFAVFFMAVLAAFVLQFVESVKNDPEAMEKIRDALEKPRT
jgi:hypothetical protein